MTEEKKYSFDTDVEETPVATGNFLDSARKAEFLGKTSVFTIKDYTPKTDKMFRPSIVIDINGELINCDLNATNKNFLIKNFGSKPINWMEKQLSFKVEKFDASTSTSGKEVSDGYSIVFSLPE